MQPLQGLPEGAIDGKTLEQYNQRKLTYDKNVAWRDGLLKEALAPLKVGDIEIPIAPQEAKEFLEFLRSSGQLGHNVDVARLRQGFFSNKLIAAAQERGSSKSKASVNDALEARRMDQPNPNPAVKASQSTKTEKVFDKNAEFGMKDPNGHNMKLIDHFRSEGLDPEAFVSELHRRSDDAR
jgi:hypothetical protein